MKQETRNKKQGTCYKKRAFTLVEIIVALAIFSIVSTVALGALVKIVSANKKAQTLQSAITNLNFTLDSISREMRVGSAFHCTDDYQNINVSNGITLESQACGLGSHEAIYFQSSNISGTGNDRCKLVHAYKFDDVDSGSSFNWQVSKATQPDCDSNIEAQHFSSLIPDNVVIEDYQIAVIYDGTTPEPDAHKYPLAVIRLSGYVGVREIERTYFDIQTAVSSRIPNE